MRKPTKKTIVKTICIAVPVAAAGVTAVFAPRIARKIRKKKYTTSY